MHPLDAFYELAAILGFLLLLKGSFDIAMAFMTREVNDLWWLGLVVGILEVLLAFWASQQLFAPRAALILIWVGFAAMFRGFTEIFLAFEVRRLSKELSRRHRNRHGASEGAFPFARREAWTGRGTEAS